MTTYNTGNPLGSAAAKDLFDNAQNLDFAVNSITQIIWKDRLGRNRKSLWGMEQDFSAQLLSQEQRFNLFIQNSGYQVIGDYADGPLTITEYNQLIRYDGELWKITAATDVPFTTTGNDGTSWSVDSSHFVSVGDAALRQNLLSSGEGLGDALLRIMQPYEETAERTQHDKNAEFISITDFKGVVGDSDESGSTGTDCYEGIQNALNSGATSIFIPVGYYRITATLKIPSNVRLYGAHMWNSCIVVDPSMDGISDALQNTGWGADSLIFDENIQLDNFRIKANGFSRTKSNADVEWGRCLRTGALKGLAIDRMVFQEGPQHCLDIACWKDNYIGVGHAGAVQGKTTDAKVTNSYLIDYCYDDGLTTHGVDGITVDNCTAIITDYAKTKHKQTITQNGFEIDDGSSNVLVSNSRTFANDTETKGFAIANHADNPIPFNVRFLNCDTYGAVAAVASLGVADSSHVFGAESYQGRNYVFNNCSLNYPHVATNNAEFPSRAIDIQMGMDVEISNFYVNMAGSSGESARSPCAVFNIIGCNVRIDGVRVRGVADGQLGTIFGTGRAWFRITNTASSNIRIKNVDIDNIGWADRVIRDVDKSPGGALIEVDNIKVGSASTDGRTKSVVMSAAHSPFRNISAPSGVQTLRIGRTLTDRTSSMTGNVDVNYQNMPTLMGGLRIFSETASDGSQPLPGLLFDRQFVSSSSALGKGSIAWRTSAATPGALSFSAYNEDNASYVPIAVMTYSVSGTPTKAIAPVVNGDTNLGQASSAWLNGYFVNSPQTVSDARLKSEVRDLTSDEISAGLEIIKTLGFWTWLDSRGDREHAGTTVQKVMSIMESHNLEPFDYAFITYEKWSDEYNTVYQYDEDGNKIEGSATEVRTKSAGDVYGFKVQELTLYLIACISSRLL